MIRKVLPTDGFMRDENTGAIVNVDNSSLAAYKLRKKANMQKENEINTMKEELAEVKSMLKIILEKINK